MHCRTSARWVRAVITANNYLQKQGKEGSEGTMTKELWAGGIAFRYVSTVMLGFNFPRRIVGVLVESIEVCTYALQRCKVLFGGTVSSQKIKYSLSEQWRK